MTRVYYNDSDAFVCAWLRNLIAAGHLPAGDVDERPIEQVTGSDVAGYDQCHFFAGIGGWAYALQLAGWGDRPVWTGSCPCQPFSTAGQRAGHEDERHLWPIWHRLIEKCKPATVFGEQVSSKLGRAWLAAIRLDLEVLDYAVGAADLCAAGVGAPQGRARFWFVADADSGRCEQRDEGQWRVQVAHAHGATDALADSSEPERGRRGTQGTGPAWLEHTSERGRASPLADPKRRPPERHGHGMGSASSKDQGREKERQRLRLNAWDGCEFIACRDGQSRPVPTQPALFPLAHGIPNRVGTLRGAGNAIVPQVAAAFVSAYMSVVDSQ